MNTAVISIAEGLGASGTVEGNQGFESCSNCLIDHSTNSEKKFCLILCPVKLRSYVPKTFFFCDSVYNVSKVVVVFHLNNRLYVIKKYASVWSLEWLELMVFVDLRFLRFLLDTYISVCQN